jgi:hypothetical protein
MNETEGGLGQPRRSLEQKFKLLEAKNIEKW